MSVQSYLFFPIPALLSSAQPRNTPPSEIVSYPEKVLTPLRCLATAKLLIVLVPITVALPAGIGRLPVVAIVAAGPEFVVRSLAFELAVVLLIGEEPGGREVEVDGTNGDNVYSRVSEDGITVPRVAVLGRGVTEVDDDVVVGEAEDCVEVREEVRLEEEKGAESLELSTALLDERRLSPTPSPIPRARARTTSATRRRTRGRRYHGLTLPFPAPAFSPSSSSPSTGSRARESVLGNPPFWSVSPGPAPPTPPTT